MDPDENLRLQKELAAKIIEHVESDDAVKLALVPALATELAEAVQDLAEWIESGGFIPRAWSRLFSEVKRVKR
jgi:hypothetical protein